MSLHYLPQLVSISNEVCIAPKLEWLNFYYCPNLKSLSTTEVSSTYLKRITGEKDWWEECNRPDNLNAIFVPIQETIENNLA